ncbi:MFS transporter [Streptomyces sp. MMBL 11-1]|uniref:MFS transporter n=1 Tax=Streptomyces sp. MMBL 11-1 TaxID=3026420 RepID=UPI00235DD998|nr:MFS transporter [Streptomyces sp. MMBL 11-1]
MGGTFAVRAAGFCYPFLPYHLDALQLSTRTVGQLLAVFGLGWFTGSVLWGWMSDKVGRRPTLTAAMAMAAIALPLLAQAHAPTAVAGAAFVAGMAYDAPRPVLSAAIAERYADDKNRAHLNATRNFIINVAAATAGASGGVLADSVGIPALLWANGTVCALFGVLAWLTLDNSTSTAADQRPAGLHPQDVLRDTRLAVLLLTSLATLTAAASLFSSLPMLMARAGLSATDYGWAQTANAAAVLALSPLLNRWLSQRAHRGRPMTGLLALSALILGTSMGAAALASTVTGFSLLAALAVPGEVLAFVAAGDVLARISPPGAYGLYAGIWGTTLAGAVVIAPVLASWSLTHGGPNLAAATTLTCGVIGAALCWPLAALTRRAPTSLPGGG